MTLAELKAAVLELWRTDQFSKAWPLAIETAPSLTVTERKDFLEWWDTQSEEFRDVVSSLEVLGADGRWHVGYCRVGGAWVRTPELLEAVEHFGRGNVDCRHPDPPEPWQA